MLKRTNRTTMYRNLGAIRNAIAEVELRNSEVIGGKHGYACHKCGPKSGQKKRPHFTVLVLARNKRRLELRL